MAGRIKFGIVFGIIFFVNLFIPPTADLKTQNNMALVACVHRALFIGKKYYNFVVHNKQMYIYNY